jgi:hypothetical protein
MNATSISVLFFYPETLNCQNHDIHCIKENSVALYRLVDVTLRRESCQQAKLIKTVNVKKGKIAPVRAMKAYRKIGGITPLILNIGTRLV